MHMETHRHEVALRASFQTNRAIPGVAIHPHARLRLLSLKDTGRNLLAVPARGAVVGIEGVRTHVRLAAPHPGVADPRVRPALRAHQAATASARTSNCQCSLLCTQQPLRGARGPLTMSRKLARCSSRSTTPPLAQPLQQRSLLQPPEMQHALSQQPPPAPLPGVGDGARRMP